MPRLLTIAGSDSGGGAGIQADLKTFAALGGFGMSAVTAVTAQNTRGVMGATSLKPALVHRQIQAVATDIGIDAAKIGMLATAAVVRRVARAVKTFHVRPLVVDPVMVATSGAVLLQKSAIRTLVADLLPLASLVTPNLAEIEVLVERRVTTRAHMEDAAQRLADRIQRAVLVTGGHRRGEAVDVLWDGMSMSRFRAPRVGSAPIHGAGCTLSAAIAAFLGYGFGLVEAVAHAKAYTTGAIEHGPDLGGGAHPLHHAWPGHRRLVPHRRLA